MSIAESRKEARALLAKNVTVIIVAAGKGLRLGTDVPKQYLRLDNEYIVSLSIEKFHMSNLVREIILVVSEEYYDFCQKEIIPSFTKVKRVVVGGDTRQHSVYEGLKHAHEKTDIILIHDAARPLIRTDDIEKLIYETEIYKSCVLGVKVKDTIKTAQCGIIKETIDRDSLYIIQTPQAFDFCNIKKAHEHAREIGFLGTDDAVLVENMGIPTRIVEGHYENIKITTAEDLEYAEFLVQKRKIRE